MSNGVYLPRTTAELVFIESSQEETKVEANRESVNQALRTGPRAVMYTIRGSQPDGAGGVD